MASPPGWTSWTQQARRSLGPCGSSTCARGTASCWCLPSTTGRVSTRWASFSHKSSESRTATTSPSCWSGTRRIWMLSARSPELKHPPTVPPTMWPTSRLRPNCVSTWMRPLSSWFGPSGSFRNKSCHPAPPVPPGRRTGAAPASSCSLREKQPAQALGTSRPGASRCDLRPSLSRTFLPWVSQDTLHPTPSLPGLCQAIATVCLLPTPSFPTHAPGGGEGLPGHCCI